jgi:hypothetical protein
MLSILVILKVKEVENMLFFSLQKEKKLNKAKSAGLPYMPKLVQPFFVWAKHQT